MLILNYFTKIVIINYNINLFVITNDNLIILYKSHNN